MIAHATNIPTEFKDLINGNAFIRYVKVARPGDLYQIKGKQGIGWVYYEACLQGDTFWIRNCKESIPGSGPMFPGFAVGASLTEHWYGRDDGYIAKSPKDGKSQQPPDRYVEDALDILRSTFLLGLTFKPGSFEITDDNSFTAQCKEAGTVTGRFSMSEDGRPQKCTYTTSSFPKATTTVTYKYPGGTNSPLPSSFTCETRMDNIVDKETYQILDCQFGKIAVPEGGFTPRSVFPEAHFLPAMEFGGNALPTFQMQPGGMAPPPR